MKNKVVDALTPSRICIVISLICLILSIASTYKFIDYIKDNNRDNLFDMTNYLNGYIRENIGYNNVKIMIKTEDPTPEYHMLQGFIDRMLNIYKHIHYIYIIRVEDVRGEKHVIGVMSAMTEQEIKRGPVPEFKIGYVSDYKEYPKELTEKLWEIQKEGKPEFIETKTKWGEDFTVVMPMKDEGDDEAFALLCIDSSSKSLADTIKSVTIWSFLLIALIIAMTIMLIIHWMTSKIYTKVNELNDGKS